MQQQTRTLEQQSEELYRRSASELQAYNAVGLLCHAYNQLVMNLRSVLPVVHAELVNPQMLQASYEQVYFSIEDLRTGRGPRFTALYNQTRSQEDRLAMLKALPQATSDQSEAGHYLSAYLVDDDQWASPQIAKWVKEQWGRTKKTREEVLGPLQLENGNPTGLVAKRPPESPVTFYTHGDQLCILLHVAGQERYLEIMLNPHTTSGYSMVRTNTILYIPFEDVWVSMNGTYGPGANSQWAMVSLGFIVGLPEFEPMSEAVLRQRLLDASTPWQNLCQGLIQLLRDADAPRIRLDLQILDRNGEKFNAAIFPEVDEGEYGATLQSYYHSQNVPNFETNSEGTYVTAASRQRYLAHPLRARQLVNLYQSLPEWTITKVSFGRYDVTEELQAQIFAYLQSQTDLKYHPNQEEPAQ